MKTEISQSIILAMCPAIYLRPSGILMWAASPYFLCKPPSLEFCIFYLSLFSSIPQPISLSSLLAISVARFVGSREKGKPVSRLLDPLESAAKIW